MSSRQYNIFIFISVCLCFILGCRGSVEQQNARAKEALKLAKIHYKKDTAPKKEAYITPEVRKNAEKAFLKLQEIVKKSPRSDFVPQALFLMAEIRDTFGQANEAIPYWLRLVYDYPDSGYTEKANEKIDKVTKKWMAAANNHAYRKRFKKAVFLYKQVLKINPYYAEAHFALGEVYSQSRRYDEAIQTYETAVAIDPNYLEAQYMLGLIFLAKNQPSEAIARFRRVTEIKPDLVVAYYNIALIYEEKLQDKKKAKETWQIYFEKAQHSDKEKKWLPTASHYLKSL